LRASPSFRGSVLRGSVVAAFATVLLGIPAAARAEVSVAIRPFETDVQPGEPLLRPVMRGGRRLPQPGLHESRALCLSQLGRLPGKDYAVEISPALRALADEVDRHT